MPLETIKPEEGQHDADVEEILFNEGELTTAGAVVAGFLDGVEWEPVFEDAELRELVRGEKLHFRMNDAGVAEECEEDTAGAESIDGEVMEGVALAHVVDADDLYGMFARYVQESMPLDTLADKHRFGVALSLLDEEDVDEAHLDEWKKKQFRTLRKKNKDMVSRMMLAMLHKGAIRRVKPGTGYPSKRSDYGPGGSSGGWKGYPSGTGGGIKAWLKYKGANAAKVKQAARKASKGKSKELSQSATQLSGKKVAKAAVKKTGKAAAKAAAKGALFGKGKKIVASTGQSFKLHEGGAGLAAAAIANTNKRQALNEGSHATGVTAVDSAGRRLPVTVGSGGTLQVNEAVK